jgi:hypothetical protein
MVMVDDDNNYPIFNFASDINTDITERRHTEGLDFQDYTKEQLGIKLGNHIADLPNILKTKYPESKKKLITVATDIYELISQIEFDEKERKANS